MAGSMTGMSEEAYRDMMIGGGRALAPGPAPAIKERKRS
jgi:hypothetical protein